MPCNNDQVAAVARALDMLDAFGVDEPSLGIVELARRTGLAKTTALRLARTLEAKRYLVRLDTGSWRLGPATAWLAARYQMAFDFKGEVQAVLRELAALTGKGTLFFVREQDVRVRLLRVEAGAEHSPPPLGERLPLERGSPGKVMLAFTGKRGKAFDEIRRRGFDVSLGETYSGVASLSAPVFGPGWSIVGALTVSCRTAGITTGDMLAHAPDAVAAARRLSSSLMRSTESKLELSATPARWFPG